MSLDSYNLKGSTQKFFIPGPMGKLEALLMSPEEYKELTAIICHPHPLYGGTMQNKVVTTLAKSLVSLGFKAILFNFRGVGQSDGAYGEAMGESEDLWAILDWLDRTNPADKILLGGFSFGSYVATRIASIREAAQLITIAPPVNHFDFDSLAKTKAPWLVIQGDQDEVVPAQAVKNWVQKQDYAIDLSIIPNATHFFHGKLLELRESIIKNVSCSLGDFLNKP